MRKFRVQIIALHSCYSSCYGSCIISHACTCHAHKIWSQAHTSMCTHTHIYSRGSNCAYLSKVLELVQSSNRIVYPTSCPRTTSISSATRWATLMAATLRGCVHDTHFLANLSFNWVSSTSHWGICVYVYMWVSSMYIYLVWQVP